MIKLRLIVTSLIIALTFGPAFTQKKHPQGIIHGEVEDFLGVRVPDASVMFENEEGKREAITNSEGDFHIVIPAGKYLVTVNHSTFYPFKMRKFIVEAGKTKKLKVILKYDTKKHPPVTK